MNDRNQPDVVYPGAKLWPEDAPKWAQYATTYNVENDNEVFDLIFTKVWLTPIPHHPDNPEPEPFEHFKVTWGWSRIKQGPWQKFPRQLEFASADAPMGDPAEVAAMLREVADVMDGSAD